MEEKELKKLRREELVDRIRLLERREQELLKENEELRRLLADKNSRLQKAGSIAQAALSLHNVFEDAQKAADQYLEEIRQLRDQARQEAGKQPAPEKPEKGKPAPEESFEIPDLAELGPEDFDPDLCMEIPEPLEAEPVPESPGPEKQEKPEIRTPKGFRQVRLDSRWLDTAPQKNPVPPKKPQPPQPEPPAFLTREREDFERLMRSLESK